MSYEILHAEVLPAVRGMPDASVHAVVSDVPYGIGTREPTVDEIVAYLRGGSVDTGGDFMGEDWEIPSVETWQEIVRVLKPGGYVFTFAHARTMDIIAMGLRAAGLRLRDTIMWLQAEGIPKPHETTDGFIRRARGEEGADDARLWEGYGHALSPAFEPILIAQKDLDGTIARSVPLHGAGALNIIGCRNRRMGDDRFEYHRREPLQRKGTHGLSGKIDTSMPYEPHAGGRWPKNVVLSHDPRCLEVGTRKVPTGVAVRVRGGGKNFDRKTPKPPMANLTYAGADGLEEVPEWACVPGCPVRKLDDQSGDRPSTLSGRADPRARHTNPGDNHGKSGFGGKNSSVYADSGAASRFYFVSKVSQAERELGCEEIPPLKPGEPHNDGKCLKPIDLTTWIAALPKPPGDDGVLLVPYAGTCSEMVGALRAGWGHVIAIERNERAVAIGHARVARWEEARKSRPEFTVAEVLKSSEAPDPMQVGLFGGGTGT